MMRLCGAYVARNHGALIGGTFCQCRVDVILCCKRNHALLAWLRCIKAYLICGKTGYLVFIEAMHLLPQGFGLR